VFIELKRLTFYKAKKKKRKRKKNELKWLHLKRAACTGKYKEIRIILRQCSNNLYSLSS
jgi:hypothetical protein